MNGIRKNCAAARPGELVRLDALAVVDGVGTNWSPGSVLVERRGLGGLVLAVGPSIEVDRHEAAKAARRVDLAGSVVIPGLVNAHTHLDLTHLGPRPYREEAGFVGWVEAVRLGRVSDAAAIADSVRRGIALARAGGTVAVGDIAGAPRGGASLVPLQELRAAGMLGVSYLEFFGIGAKTEALQERLTGLLDAAGAGEERLRVGLQPHAPNTVGLRLYEWAARLAAARGVPIATHLAETPDEREFVARAAGPQRAMLERLGVWEESALEHIGRGKGPVEHLAGVLGMARFVAAHVNDADDAAIETLARTGTSVAYCPRASAYFGAERIFGGHRYQEMMAAGVSVALGTDSIVNLPVAAASVPSGGISVLDEMRLLHRRDGVDGRMLLRMGTLNGAAALGLDVGLFRIEPGSEVAGLVAVEVGAGIGGPLERMLLGGGRASLLFGEN